VNCMPRFDGSDTDGGSLPEQERQRAGQVRNRQAAALYLQAATMADNAVTRELLRRRAARLILPDPSDRDERLVC
jgi:hypothetical protein